MARAWFALVQIQLGPLVSPLQHWYAAASWRVMFLEFAGPVDLGHRHELLAKAHLCCHDFFSLKTAGFPPFQWYEPGHDHPTDLEIVQPDSYTAL